jgi:hypothetical protein
MSNEKGPGAETEAVAVSGGMYERAGKSRAPFDMEIENARLARAYVPYQRWCGMYEPMEALKKGTVFPTLYEPYAERGRKEGY